MKVLEIIKINKTKYKVLCEDNVVFSLYISELKNLSIETGSDISDEKFAYIKDEILYKRCKEYCLHLLESSDKTECQIRTKLREKFFEASVIEKTIDFLKKYNYIDDIRYIENYINLYKSSKSMKIISRDLLKKGINLNEMKKESQSLCEIDNEENERIQVINLLTKKKYSTLSGNPNERRKIIAYILRSGYSYELICSCIREEFAE